MVGSPGNPCWALSLPLSLSAGLPAGCPTGHSLSQQRVWQAFMFRVWVLLLCGSLCSWMSPLNIQPLKQTSALQTNETVAFFLSSSQPTGPEAFAQFLPAFSHSPVPSSHFRNIVQSLQLLSKVRSGQYKLLHYCQHENFLSRSLIGEYWQVC